MVKITQNSWLGGQLDPEMAGRQDVSRYKIGATTILNFVPTRRGNLRKRPGTNFVADLTELLKDAAAFRVIPFRFTTRVGYALILVEGAGWVYGSDGTVKKVNGTLPYKADELKEIVYVQCGDIVYLAHNNHPPAEIDHGGTGADGYTAWSYDETSLWKATAGNKQTVSDIVPRLEYEAGADGKMKWTLSYAFRVSTYSSTSKTGDPTATEEYSVAYVTADAEDSEGALTLTFAKYTYVKTKAGADDETKTVALAANKAIQATRKKRDAGDTAEEFYYKTVKNGVSVARPTVTGVTMTRLDVAPAYRGGKAEVRYAATVVEELDGAEYESQPSPSTASDNSSESYTAYMSSGTEETVSCDGGTYTTDVVTRLNNHPELAGRLSSKDTTFFYLPWTESQVMTVSVQVKAQVARHITEMRLYKFNGACYGLIANDATGWRLKAGETASVTFRDDNVTPDTSVTPFDEKSVFDGDGNYPACVAMYQQRLVWASSKDSPARIWMSAAGDFYEHRPHAAMQLSDPIDFVVPLTDGTAINFIVELGRLFAFADASEYLIGSDSSSSGVTYETIFTTRQSGVGCAKWLPPIVVNNSLIFCERTGRSVRSYNYDVQQNLYGGEDISVYSSGIFDEKRIVDWAYQQSPESVLWCVLDDGTMASLTYMKDQTVCAWATHAVGGGGKVRGIAATNAIIGNDGDNTTTMEILMVVERGGRWTLEQMRPWAKTADTAANAVCMDCTTAGDRSAEGMTYVAAAGASGYPFASEMTTMQPIIGSEVGNAQFDVKNAHHAHIRAKNAVGGSVKAADAGDALATPLKTTTLPEADADGLMTFGTRDESVVLNGSNNRDGRITVKQNEPWPFQLLLLEQDFEVEEGDNG